jgi:NACalpha-BTF3-like transcription factor
MISGKIILILLAIMALMSAAGYAYFKYSQNEIDVAKAKVVQLDIANKAQAAHIEKMKADEAQQKQIREKVDEDFAKSRKDVDIMRQKLEVNKKNGTDKNLGKAAAEKPLIIQTAINRGTADQTRCFEILSGALLTEGEKNGSIKNSICPELFGAN